MKRAEKHLRYSATNRRPQLDEARYGSLIKLLILVGSLALASAAAVFFIVPLLRSIPFQKEEAVPDSGEQTPVWSEKISYNKATNTITFENPINSDGEELNPCYDLGETKATFLIF